ncbi:vesicle-associated protein 2-2-like isoform X2 [Cucurbita pepo subsp. pepo]|uniref:vesicle-associated protein 2-2-like isoform X2 n=1 Tax=Cucurbita pepo subsp. pepo TaxID=3664 RepID=UPI000C9D2761|nr:vesicle-associated protein 2-2-like isoform X2 [Cucurbita pepo subsp. pepo]XP_023546960.1 vesicle-associated protein 2-2-like isoform X2 [Cucurbita pepo subsp. pepo]
MSTKLLHIQPKELQFIFELRKQSTCTVQLANNTHHHVAFKVKTTSPKKYCVRPNVGIILPKSTYEFSVIMQAQRAAPPDMLCRDKFLIQSTIVPSGMTEEDITASMFLKDGGKYIEEDKLKVALISPLNSPLLSPTDDGALGASMDEVMKLNEHSGPLRDGIATNKTPKLKDQNGSSDEGVRTIEALKPSDQNGALRKEVLPHETSRLMDQNGTSKEELPHEALKLSDQNGASKEEELSVEVPKKRVQNGALDWRAYETSNVENLPPTVVDVQPPPFERIFPEGGLAYKTSHVEDPVPETVAIRPPDFSVKFPDSVDESLELNNGVSRLQKSAEIKKAAELDLVTLKKAEQLKLVKDIEEMKSKLNEIELKLGEAQGTISMLFESRRLSAQEVKHLKEKLMELSRKGRASNQVGFPPLFICMVALICVVLGFILHH